MERDGRSSPCKRVAVIASVPSASGGMSVESENGECILLVAEREQGRGCLKICGQFSPRPRVVAIVPSSVTLLEPHRRVEGLAARLLYA